MNISIVGSICLHVFLAMIKILLISIVGVLCAKYPTKEPLLTLKTLQQLAKLSNLIFLPCLIVSSLGSAVTIQLLSRLGMLILFSFMVNLISMLIVFIVGKYTINDECMKIAMSVAMFSPNAISMPIMVMQSLCEQEIINHDYNNDSKMCYSEASSMLFVYSIGWHVLFWSYGFNQLKRIPEIIANYNNAHTGGNTVMTPKSTIYSNQGEIKRFIEQVVFTPSMVAIIIGILIGITPGLQSVFYTNMNSVLHPFGSATITLGEPVVSINCLIMSGSLAHINLDLLKATKQNNYKGTTTNPIHEDELVHDDKHDNNNDNIIEAAPVKPYSVLLPSTSEVITFLACRLVLPPLVILPIVLFFIKIGFLDKKEKMMQLIMVIESASTSAQLVLVSLNQLGISDIATNLAYLYVFQYSSSIVTMTIFATIAIAIFYD